MGGRILTTYEKEQRFFAKQEQIVRVIRRHLNKIVYAKDVDEILDALGSLKTKTCDFENDLNYPDFE